MSRLEIKCPVCKIGKFHNGARKFALKGIGNPDFVVDAAICATCGYILLMSTPASRTNFK